MKVSIIVAAYNAENYLAETLESLTHQTLADYEIIVVNDGSVDQTLDILRKYEAEYANLHVIDKENGGPSSARNAGIAVVKGSYLYFFDADDILELDALESLYLRALDQDADLVVAKYDIFNKYKTFPVNNIDDLVLQDDIEKYDLLMLWTFSLCNKLFKKSVIDQYNLRLPPISYSEDGAFLMNYIYHAHKITGLDQVIFHYRRMYNGEAESITASVSPQKVKDYITAHQLILDQAKQSILNDYPQYPSIEAAITDNLELQRYLSEIMRKELHVLLNQFYPKFWSLDEATISLIVTEINERLSSLNMHNILQLIDAYPDYSLFDLPVTQAAMLEQASFTAVLYGSADTEEDFLTCLHSLTIQNLTGIKILVPAQMRTCIEQSEFMQNNIFFLDAASEDDLFGQALTGADTPYITFCDSKIVYVNNTFKYMFKRFIKSPADFLIELIYHRDFGDPQVVSLNRAALDTLTTGMTDTPYLAMDRTLANKFFRVEFLRSFLNSASNSTYGAVASPSEASSSTVLADSVVSENHFLLKHLHELYLKGFYDFFNDGIVVYTGTDESFLEYIATAESRSFLEDFFLDRPVPLDSPELARIPGRDFPKLQLLPQETFAQRFLFQALRLIKKLPVRDRVLFLSVRKDKELEGNAKALYPYIKGKKIAYAKMLPHGTFTSLKMFYYIATSKVIITDDYIRYLRHIPLRPEQKVIQLWHACGAFKKFGQRGTNIAVNTDLATHAQYNLVTVSGQHIRPVYADAFGINLQRVKALGCPRTDAFYQPDYINSRKAAIYEKHPEWKDKFIIIYAPTFRDIGNKRDVFQPPIDFDLLSKQLLPNQLFLVCPHPVMKNDIVPKTFPNISLVRDFSTNDMMLVSDMLITDYSSVIFEYVLLKKPIGFFCYDLPTYNRGFYLHYPEDLPGDIYETQTALTNYLTQEEQHKLTDKYNLFLEKYMSSCDGHSCERIAALVNSYMEGSAHE